MEVRLANPRGFCAGVDRAIDIVNRALEVFENYLNCKHSIITLTIGAEYDNTLPFLGIVIKRDGNKF